MYRGQLPSPKASRTASIHPFVPLFILSSSTRFGGKDSRDKVGDLNTELARDTSSEEGTEESTESCEWRPKEVSKLRRGERTAKLTHERGDEGLASRGDGVTGNRGRVGSSKAHLV